MRPVRTKSGFRAGCRLHPAPEADAFGEFIDKVVPLAVEREEGSESNYTGGMLRPCRDRR